MTSTLLSSLFAIGTTVEEEKDDGRGELNSTEQGTTTSVLLIQGQGQSDEEVPGYNEKYRKKPSFAVVFWLCEPNSVDWVVVVDNTAPDLLPCKMAQINHDQEKQTITLHADPYYPSPAVFDLDSHKPRYFGSVFYYNFTHTLYINHDKEEPVFEQKLQLLKERQLKTEYYLNENDLLTSQLLQAIRICLMKDLEVYFREANDVGMVTPRNEIQLLATVKKDIHQRRDFLASQQNSDTTINNFLQAQIRIANAMLDSLSKACQQFCEPANVVPLNIPPSTDEKFLNIFYEWLGKGGVDYKKVAVADFDGFGRGMKANQQIPEGDIAVSVPRRMILNVETAYGDEKLGPIFREIEGLDDDTILLLFVIHERFHNESSFWKPYFDVLYETFPTALNYGANAFVELEGTPLVDELFQARDHLRGFHEMLFPKLSDYYPTIFPESVFTYENFLWARSLFDSRAIKLKIGEKILPCLIPMADMLNHHHHAQVSRGNFSEEKGAFVAYTLCNVPAGSQVFLHYGALPNWQLLLYYGFVIRNNQYDNFHIGFEHAYTEDESITTQKEELMKKLGLSLEHFLSFNRLSSKVLSSLQICHADAEEVQDLSKESADVEACKAKLLTAAQTESTVATLMTTLRGLLTSFPKTAKEDLKALTASSKASGAFVTSVEELVSQTDSILAHYKEDGHEDGEKGEDAENEDGEEGKEDGEGGDMSDQGSEEEPSEETLNILEYRIGQLMIIMQSIKFAHATLEKKRKHAEI